jgi:hypothetical protein
MACDPQVVPKFGLHPIAEVRRDARAGYARSSGRIVCGGTHDGRHLDKPGFPVLEAAVRLLDAADPQWVSVQEIAADTGLDEDAVTRALIALHPRYVGEMDQFSGGPGPWTIQAVMAEAREQVGQWPTPESLIERLADGFNAAAEREPDEQKRGRLREMAGMLTGTLKDLAVAIAGEVIARKVP